MTTQTVATAIAGLLLVAAAACTDTTAPAATSVDRAAVFDAVWRDVDRHYSYFEYKRIDWDSLGARYRPLAIDAATDSAFGRVLGHLLAELRDVHVSVTPPGGIPIRYVSPFDTIATHVDARRTVERYVARSSVTGGGHVIDGMVGSRIGYLRIPSFAGRGWAGEVDRALDDLRGAKSLIVDVRGNMGGDRALAVEIAGRFADRTRTFGFLRYRSGSSHRAFTAYETERVTPAGGQRFRGPVYLLANRRVFSSAEEFVLAMRTLPSVTVVGDTTGGASGGPIVRALPNGWTYQFSRWMEYTANGLVYEGVGLAPDAVVQATQADERAGRDRALEVAIALAAARSTR